MKQRLLAFFRFAKTEAKRCLRFIFRHTFSWYGGLFGFLLLIVVLAWLLIYQPTIGEAKRIDFITAEFKAHGCRSIHAEAVPMFETHWLLKHFKLEKKVLYRLTFGPGAEVPQAFLEHPPYLPDLHMITFEDSNPSNEEFVWAIGFPSLQSLTVAGPHKIDERGFLAVENRNNYFRLKFSRNPSITADLRYLSPHANSFLSSLFLEHCELNVQCFEALGKMYSLQQLVLSDCAGFSAEGMKKLQSGSLTSLLILNYTMSMEDFDDDVLEAISKMTSLIELSISIPSHSSITERGIDSLKNLPHLREIRGLPPDKQTEFDELIRRRIESMP